MGRYAEAEPLYLRTLVILINVPPENHTHIQAAWGKFHSLIQQAIQSDRRGELSNHPITQAILQQIQTDRSE